MRFKEWLQEADWLDGPVLEGMLALHRLVEEFFEATGGEPITLEPGQRDFKLATPVATSTRSCPPHREAVPASSGARTATSWSPSTPWSGFRA